ncbi:MULTISPECIES: YeeE/YedE family protein [Paraburkholderia]|uniref:YeeE/YedE family protein n=1 Tax=Paraburkholderia podalyriae TaxID=1938811 RepID=A0ABR7PJW0_9BURK|nr:YeeE/YedE family protein [Paraburkholderia podalyriae]MBC8746659.1 YeeE/YedE family protein [Paraburkholderia podalyriae]
MATIVSFVCGLLFGFGLLLSGMANPAKVLGFLDITGRWNPSLAFVMIGAVAVAAIGFAIAKRRDRSLLGLPIQVPASAHVTRRLLLGSGAFGVGWGIAGFCPGPALVALGLGSAKAWVFVAAMIAGMAVFERLERRSQALTGGLDERPLT